MKTSRSKSRVLHLVEIKRWLFDSINLNYLQSPLHDVYQLIRQIIKTLIGKPFKKYHKSYEIPKYSCWHIPTFPASLRVYVLIEKDFFIIYLFSIIVCFYFILSYNIFECQKYVNVTFFFSENLMVSILPFFRNYNWNLKILSCKKVNFIQKLRVNTF